MQREGQKDLESSHTHEGSPRDLPVPVQALGWYSLLLRKQHLEQHTAREVAVLAKWTNHRRQRRGQQHRRIPPGSWSVQIYRTQSNWWHVVEDWLWHGLWNHVRLLCQNKTIHSQATYSTNSLHRETSSKSKSAKIRSIDSFANNLK